MEHLQSLTFHRYTAIRGLIAAREYRAYYNDTVERGLQLEVYSTGRKTFALYKKINGRPERHTIGPHPDWTIEQVPVRTRN